MILILFPYYECFFPIQFPSYDIPQHMGNAWVSPLISHSTGKCNKTHSMGKVCEIYNHTIPIVWVLFFHLSPILWYTLAYGKCMGFPHKFPTVWENATKPMLWEKSGKSKAGFPQKYKIKIPGLSRTIFVIFQDIYL